MKGCPYGQPFFIVRFSKKILLSVASVGYNLVFTLRLSFQYTVKNRICLLYSLLFRQSVLDDMLLLLNFT